MLDFILGVVTTLVVEFILLIIYTSYTDTNITVPREEQYMNGFKKLTDAPLSITSISTGTKDNVIVRGDGSSGVSINFENPYMLILPRKLQSLLLQGNLTIQQ